MNTAEEKRPRGRGPAVLVAVTYPLIAQMTGLSIHTVRRHAREGRYRKDNLDNVLSYINAIRVRNGEGCLGLGGLTTQQPAASDPLIDNHIDR